MMSGKCSCLWISFDKPGKLTEMEFEQIQKHADYGFHLIKNVHTVSLLVANCAYQHHERLDGSGYPRWDKRG